MKPNIHFWSYLAQFSLEWEMFQTKDVEKIKTHFVFNNFFYTGCPRRNGQNFGRVFLMLNYTDITQNTCIQSW